MNLRCATVLCFATLLSSVIAGPVDSTKCATQCPTSTKFSYTPGQTYVYTYESDVKTSVAGATEEHSSLHVRATANIEVISACEMSLTLSDVSLLDSNPANYDDRKNVDKTRDFKNALQQRDLRFAYLDGIVESICPDPSEKSWVLNIKKGIVSALQNAMDSLSESTRTRETDVTGDCPVTYEVEEGSRGTKKITKVKDILACTDRHGYDSFFQATPYKVPSNIQSMPLMKTTHECTQVIAKNGIISESACAEKHTFRPFAKHHNGATTEVSYKLTFSKQAASVKAQQAQIQKRVSLVFDHDQTDDQLSRDVTEAQNTLEALCSSTTVDIRPDTPSLFAKLVRLMRQLDTPTLRSLHQKMSSSQCANTKKFFYDAIPLIGSTASIALARDLIQKGQATDAQVSMWLTSFAFISNPTSEILNEAQGLLDIKTAYRKAALAVSSVVHTYCSVRPACEDEPIVKAIVKVFETNLRYNCRADSADEHDSVLASLKAFGNLGFAGTSKAVLDRCVSNEELPTEVRVVATNAYRRMKCNLDRVEVMKVFTNTRQDSELRINAYLAMIPCADDEIIRRLKDVLEAETVNQVGSFVWTHLTNLLETSSPHKQAISEIVDNVDLKKEFDMDKRKFSRNVEWSLFSEMLNTGAAVESNLVWSEDSYIPRSTSLNLTVDVFGHSINLFEIGARAQGLEKLIEQVSQPTQENSNAIPSGINQFDQQYKVPKDKTQASYYMRMFGNEIRYGDFHDFDFSGLKDKFNFLDFLIDLSNEHNIDVTKSLMFLDASVSIPTTIGLPLTLSVDGTTSTNIKVKGKMDIRQLFARPSNLDISGSLTPSAAVEVEGLMSVDAFFAKTGLRMVSTLHSSTVLDGKIYMQEGQLFNLDLNMPRDRIEVVNIESKFYVTYRDSDRPQKMITDDRVEQKGCYTDLVKPLGVQFCGEVSWPLALKQETSPWFPFSGPARASILINKVDTHTGYHFDMKYYQEKRKVGDTTAITDSFSTNMNTPGSQVNRRIVTEFTLKRAEKSVRLAIVSPWSKVEITGDAKYEDSLKRIAAGIKVNENSIWSLIAELKTEDSKKTGLTYTPNFEIVGATSQPLTLKGTVAYREGRRGDVDLTLASGTNTIISVKGNMQKTVESGKTNQGSVKYDVNFDVDATNYVKSKVTGFYKNGMEEVRTHSTRFQLEYSVSNRRAEKITLTGKLRDKSQGNTIQYSADGSMSNTLYPKNDVDFTAEVGKSPSSLSLNLDSGFDKTRRIKFATSTNYALGAENKISGDVSFDMPSEKWQAALSLDHSHTDGQIKCKVGGKLNQQEASFELGSSHTFQPLKLNADVKVKYPGRDITLKHIVDERKPSEYAHNFNIQYDKNAKIEVNSVYKMKPRHELTTDISYPGLEKINLQGYVTPNVMNMQGHGEFTMGKRKYSTDVNWLVEAAKVSGDARITLPSRTVTLATEASKNGNTYMGSVSTKWNADKDETMKAAFGGQITLSPQSPAAQFNVEWYPKQFVTFATNGKIESQNWQKTSPDMEAKIQLRTSFDGAEDISGSFTHDATLTGLKTGGEVSWSTDKKLGSEFEVKYGKDGIDVVLTAKTPFAGYKTLKAATSYKWQKNKLDTNVEASWETKRISLSTSSSLDVKLHSLTGRVTMTTPFAGYELAEISVKHKDNGAVFNTNFDVSWNKQKASAVFKLDHTASGWTFANKGEISLTGPFNVFKTAKTSWDTQLLPSNLRLHAELEADKQRGVFDIQGSHEIAGSTRKINVRGSITSPIANLQSVSISYNRESDVQSWKYVKSDGSVQWAPNRAISFTHEFGLNHGSSFRYKSTLTTPFSSYEKFSADFNTEISGSTYTTRNELARGDQKLALEGTLSINGYEFQGNARFTSPFKPVTSIVTNVKTTKVGNTWKSHYDLEYMPNQKLELDTDVTVKDSMKIGFALKTPFQQAQKVAGSVGFTGSSRNFEVTAEAEHNLLDKKMTGSLKVDVSALPTIKINVNVITPFRPIAFFRHSFNHKLTGKTTYVTDGKFEIPQYSLTASHELNLRSAKNVNSKASLEWKSGTTSRKFEATTQFQASNSITFRTTLKTPYEGFEEMSANFAQDGSLKNWRVTAELAKGSDKIALTEEFIMSDNTIRGTARLTTPFSQLEKVEATFVHSGTRPTFKNTVSLQINDKTFSVDNEFSFQQDSIKLSSHVDTPLNGFESMSLNFEHKGTPLNFKTSAAVQYPSNTFSTGLEFSYIGTVAKGKFSLSTPLQKFGLSSPLSKFSGMNVEFTNDAKKWNDFENNWSVEVMGQRYNGNSEVRYAGKTKTASAYANIPEKYGFKVTQTGEPETGINSNVKIEYADKEINYKYGYKITKTSMEESFKLTTPYSGYENFEYTWKLAGSLNQFRLDGVAKTNMRGYETFRIELNHVSTDFANIRTTARLDTPLNGWSSLAATFTHVGKPTDFTSKLTLEKNQQKIEKTLKFKKSADGFEVTSTLTTPMNGWERFEKSIKYTGTAGKKSLAVEVQTPFGNYNRFKAEGSYEIKKDGVFSHSIRVDTSIPGYESFVYTVDVTKGTPTNGATARINVRTPFEQFETTNVELSGSNTAKTQQFYVKVDTSMPKVDSISATFVHDYVDPNDKSRGCSMKTEVKTPIKGFESTSFEYAWSRDARSNKIQATAKLDTSTPYDVFTTTFSLTPDAGAFSSRLEITTPFQRYTRFSAEASSKTEKTKVTYNGKIETSVQGFELFSTSVSMDGDWRSTFTIKSEVNTPIVPYNHFATTITNKVLRNSVETSAGIETSIPTWQRMGMRMTNNNTPKGIRNTIVIDTPIRGYEKITTDLDHKGSDARSIVTRFTANVGSHQFGADLNHKGENSGMKSSFEATSNLPGYERFNVEYSHEGDAKNFRGAVKINTPFQAVPSITAEIAHKRTDSSCETTAVVEYAPTKRYESKIVLSRPASKTAGGDWEATLELKSPHAAFQDFSFTGKHSIKSPLSDGELVVTFNGNRKFAVNFDYTRGPDYRCRVTFTDPQPMEYRMSFTKGEETLNAELNANWNMQRSDSNFKTTLELTNQIESSQTTRKIAVGVATLGREVSMATSYILSSDRFAHKTEVQWEANKKFSYDFDWSKAVKRNQRTYDAKLNVNSQIEVAVSHKIVNSKQQITEVTLKSSSRLVIKSDLTLNKPPSFKHILTLQSPRFTKDVVISTEGNIEPGKVYDGKIGIKYEDQAIDFAGRVADESTKSDMKYTAQCSLSHPNSATDFQFKGEMKNDQKSAGGNVEYKWLAYDRSTKMLSAKTEFNRIQNEAVTEITSPMGTLSFNVRQTYASHDEGVYRYTITTVVGSKNYRTEAELNRQERSVEAKFYYTTDNFVHVYAKYMSAYHMQLEVYRQHNGEKINDVLVALKLKEDNIINGKLFFRPGLKRDLKTLSDESDFAISLERGLNSMSNAVYEELNYKAEEWTKAARPVGRAIEAIGNELNTYTSQLSAIYSQMYKRNDFYLRTVVNTLSAKMEALSRLWNEKTRNMRASLAEFNEDFAYNMKEGMRRLSHVMRGLRNKLDDSLETAAYLLQNAIDKVGQYWPYYTNLKARLADLNEIVMAKIAEMKEKIKNHPRIEPYLRRIPSPTPENYMIAVRDAAVDYARTQIPDDVENYARDIWNNVGRRTEVRNVISAMKRFAQKVKYYYDYYEIDSASMNLLTDIYTRVWQMTKAQTLDFIDNYLQLDRTRWTTWDPQTGNWEFDLWIPLKMPSLERLPELPNFNQYVNRLRNMAGDIMPDPNWVFWDTWYTYKPSSDYMNVIPPFKTRASLVGNQHYMTFDRKFYEYAGECTYLLARDFINGKFSVSVNYERAADGSSAKKSISVATGGRQIAITPVGKITVDSKRSELPLQIDGTTITRNGNVLRLDNINGLTITCDLAHDRCTMNVTGWYYGKTGGMFGTYDNEPHNDIMMPSNVMAEDIESFADSWTVGQKCRKTNHAVSLPTTSDRRNSLCAKYFKDKTSEFRNCFKIVSPEPFMSMCLNDLPTNINRLETDEDVCNITAFYVDECRREGVPLRMPKVCVRCDLESGRSFFEGDSLTLSETNGNLPRAADVVFMIQHADCNRAPVEKLKTFVDEMEKAFRIRGINDVRYAIVAYGGLQSLSGAHVHTIDGQIFNNREMFQYGLDGFNSESGSDAADGLLALRYVMRMPFRSGVSKNVVMMPCASCSEKSISYAEVQQVLFEADVRLHVMLDHSFEIKGKSPKSVSNYGADREAIYSRRDAGKKDVAGDKDLRSQVSMPKDLCAALAEETDGSVFSSQQIVNRRPDEIKAFLDVFAHVIARKGEPTKCQRCECVVDETGVGKSMCRSCNDRLPMFSHLPIFGDESSVKITPIEPSAPIVDPPQPEPTKPSVEIPKPVPEKPVVKPTPARQTTTTTAAMPARKPTTATKPPKPTAGKPVKPPVKPKPAVKGKTA